MAAAPLTAGPALPSRRRSRDFDLNATPGFSDLLSNIEDPCTELLGVCDSLPPSVTCHDDTEGGPYPVMLFDEDEVGSELRRMPGLDLLR